jgi:exopolysaccharide biosynthesis polyprenyl glycosylphosphotransferase
MTDIVTLALAFAIVEARGGFDGGATSSIFVDAGLIVLAIPFWVLLAQAHNLYHADSRRADHGAVEELMSIIQMATIWSWGTLMLVSATGLRPVTVDNLAFFWLVMIVLVLALRAVARKWARSQTWYLQNAVIVGTLAETEPIVTKLLRHPEYGINVVASIDQTHSDDVPEEPTGGRFGRFLAHVPLIRGEVQLVELVEQLDVDRVIFAPSARDAGDHSETLCDLADLDVHIDLVPSWCDVVGRRLDFHELEGMSLLTVPRTVTRRSDLIRKRAFDIVASSLGLLALAPILAVCAIAIKLDSSGPILFRQRRVGRDDERFEVLKFRSMEAGADARKEEVAELNLHSGGTVEGMFKIREDPRVTRVGRWLRRFSLDELPQLINVLRGEMSLVGPRPLIEDEDRRVAGRFRRRVTATPGLTGPWQIHGRSEIPFEDMIALDYLYVTNWSLWGDVKLLLKTVGAVYRGRGAY